MVDARSATAADFDRAAQRQANAFWGWAVVAGLVWWQASVWWAIIPALAAVWYAVGSVVCTRSAGKLRAGTYRLLNVNNGAPDGDARNWLPR